MIATYMLMDTRSRMVIHKFEANGDFDTTAVAFLSSYCSRTGAKPEEIDILTLDTSLPVEEIRKKVSEGLRMSCSIYTAKLTRRERQLGTLLIRDHGISNKECAEVMNLSERTIKFHVSSLLAKFGLHNRGALTEALTKSSALREEAAQVVRAL
jgi:DNA-binding NarL/FixJ family response regulator